MTVAIFNLTGNIPAPGDWLIMWARGAAITGLIFFNSLEDMPSTSQSFVTEKSDIILCTAVPSMHWNSNEDIIFCFMYVLIVFGVLQCILCDKSLPKLAKNELKLDAISCFDFVLFPLIIKTFGNESLFLFLFKTSLMVDQVRRMLNLYSSNFLRNTRSLLI